MWSSWEPAYALGDMVLGLPKYPNRSYEPHRQLAARELFSPQNLFSRSNRSLLCPADPELMSWDHEDPATDPKSGTLKKTEYWNYFWRKLPLDVTPKGLIHQNPSWSALTFSFFYQEKVERWNVDFLRTCLRINETWSSDYLSTRIGLTIRTVNLLRESYFHTKIHFLAQTIHAYAMQILSCHVLGP